MKNTLLNHSAGIMFSLLLTGCGSVPHNADIRIPLIDSLMVSPNTRDFQPRTDIQGGANWFGKITLDRVAAEDFKVRVTSSNRDIINTDKTIVVPFGSSSVVFKEGSTRHSGAAVDVTLTATTPDLKPDFASSVNATVRVR